MWSPHQYIVEGRREGIPDDVLSAAVEQIEHVSQGDLKLPGILSLNHLAVRTQTPYQYLRQIVERRQPESYRKFSIRKRSGGRRFIHIPAPALLHVQKWIHAHILSHAPVHSCSFAFARGSSIYACAARHCGAQWLVKMDITGFFESISEIQVYRVFKELGYQPLVAFELARVVTVAAGSFSSRYHDPVWKVRHQNLEIPSYANEVLGYLPQGAPTSPMLSNLVMRELDQKISAAAKLVGLTYTRYSDDLTFSSRDKGYNRHQASSFIHTIDKILSPAGFRPQHRKTAVIPPGSRKIVLGLLVDGDRPTLRREFKDFLRQHIYYLEKCGPTEHAIARKFNTLWGMKSHIRGLIDFANMVEPEYAKELLGRFESIDWPY